MTGYVPQAELAFELDVTCDPPTAIGRIGQGNGMMIPITGGTVFGPRLSGEVLPGGADWAVRGDDGWSLVDARYAIQADDGTIIQVFNSGTNRLVPGEPLPNILTTPRFVAPEGPHDWLNRSIFVGTLVPQAPGGAFAVRIGIFRLV